MSKDRTIKISDIYDIFHCEYQYFYENTAWCAGEVCDKVLDIRETLHCDIYRAVMDILTIIITAIINL